MGGGCTMISYPTNVKRREEFMNPHIYNTYVALLTQELVVAVGCTEPIALAYAGAKARQVLGVMPTGCTVLCSGNIVKNVKGVTVPNSGGMKGIDVAVTLGIVGGDADQELAVLENVTDEDISATRALLSRQFCQCQLIHNVEKLKIVLRVSAGDSYAEIEVKDYHSNISRIEKNGVILYSQEQAEANPISGAPDKSLLNVRDILDFARQLDIADVKEVLQRQIDYNTAISREGLEHPYGAEVGRVLQRDFGGTDSPKLRAKAAAAAGSDARMSGCPLPVVINSGSGNQGITATLPVVEYAKTLNAGQDQLYRALALSNLISIHQKKYIGSLSAYCGAVSAACGSGAAICYMMGGDYDEICDTITNTLANIGGMVCDGAKPSCAAKIASAVEAAVMAVHLSRNKKVFQPGEGLVKGNVEDTIASIGRMGREGMKATDIEILNIMLED